jgi:hypothetical protein
MNDTYEISIVLHQIALEGFERQGAIAQSNNKRMVNVSVPGWLHIRSAEDIIYEPAPEMMSVGQ